MLANLGDNGMKIEECTVGLKVKIPANRGGVKHHFAFIDSLTRDVFTNAPLVIIRVLGDDKIVPPDVLIKIKRPKTKIKKSHV